MTIKELMDKAVDNNAIYYKLYTMEDIIDLTHRVRELYDLKVCNNINLNPSQIDYLQKERDVYMIGRVTDEDSVYLFVNEELNNAILGIVKNHRGISWGK